MIKCEVTTMEEYNLMAEFQKQNPDLLSKKGIVKKGDLEFDLVLKSILRTKPEDELSEPLFSELNGAKGVFKIFINDKNKLKIDINGKVRNINKNNIISKYFVEANARNMGNKIIPDYVILFGIYGGSMTKDEVNDLSERNTLIKNLTKTGLNKLANSLNGEGDIENYVTILAKSKKYLSTCLYTTINV